MKKILLIEDDQSMATVLGDNLIAANFNVVKAIDGETGLAMALEQKPDLILLNIILPKMGGFTLLKNLRQDEWGKGVPIIILTNLSSPTTISEAVEELEPGEYLIKIDWRIEDLVKKIKEKLA